MMVSWYGLFKFLHIASAIIWLGGGFALVFQATLVSRANDTAALGRILPSVGFLSPRLLVPAGLSTLLFGILIVINIGTFDFLWMWLALIGFAATFSLGLFFLKPQTEAVVPMIETLGMTPDVVSRGMRILRLAQFDMVLLFSIVLVMVLKPTWADWWLILILAIVIAGAAWYLLNDMMRPVIDSVMKRMQSPPPPPPTGPTMGGTPSAAPPPAAPRPPNQV